MQIQLRPEFAVPQELLDVRVRRAIAHSLKGRFTLIGD
jgi:hypothetical protein